MPPTIAIDIRTLGTGRASGIEEYTEHLLERMVMLNTDARFKLFYAGRTPLVRRPWMDTSSVQVYDTRRSNRLLLATTRLLGLPHLDQAVGGADVFFFPHFLDAATSPSCRRVLTFHDLSYERFSELFSVQRRLWHQIQMQPRRQARAADRLIAVSESTRQDLLRLYHIPSAKVSTIHSGVDSTLGRPSESELTDFSRRKNLPKRFVLALSTIEPRKNLASLVRAFGMLPREFADVGLVIAGPRGWLWRETLDAIASSSARERIRVAGDIPSDERSYWLSTATVLAYPSLFEGFGFPPLEAMACATPVIIGANSSMLEVCGSAALAVDPYSVFQLTHALGVLLNDSQLRQCFIERGLARVRSLSWSRCAEKTLEAIFSTL